MVEYRYLGVEEIKLELFSDFIRRQEVKDCLRWDKGKLVVRADPFVDDWTGEDYCFLVECLRNTINTGGWVYAAFYNGKLKGFAALKGEMFQGYMDLAAIHVSRDMRGQGIGRVIFNAMCQRARERGAERLYISAHSAVESQAFYRAMGCTPAEYYHREHVEAEPYDVQLEYRLN